MAARSPVPRVAVVGAGVIGLSTGLCLLETYKKQVDVTIIADRFSPHTTASDRAGAIFIGRLIRTHHRLKELYDSSDTPDEVGLSLPEGYTGSPEKCSLVNGVFVNEKELTREQAEAIGPLYANLKSVFSGSTFMIQCSKYLSWLMKRFRDNGGLMIRKKLDSLDELVTYDLVINCSGLGARELAEDESVYPKRGQIVKVRAPKVTKFYHIFPTPGSTARTYALLQPDHIILGGTIEPNNWSTIPDPSTAREIIGRCRSLDPGFREAEVIGGWVGLRPTRDSGVRLEIEHKRHGQTVVHNYGHGGEGYILSWGCAQEAVGLVRESLRQKGFKLTETMAKL